MEKIKYIEGMKGLLILIVLFHHYIFGFYPALISGYPEMTHVQSSLEITIAQTPLNIFYNGNFAVCIFFILSGYILSYKYFVTKNHGYIFAGASKRYFRLLPPVVLSIFIAYICMKLGLFFNKEAGSYSKSIVWLSALWQFEPNFWNMIKEGFYGVFFESKHAYNSFLWIIAFEFIGSYLVFSTVALFGNQRNRHIFYLLMIFLLFNTYFMLFIMGVIASDLKNNSKFFIQYSHPALTFFILLIGIYFGSYPTDLDSSLLKKSLLFGYLFNNYNEKAYIFAHSWGAFLVLLAVLSSEKIQNILSNSLLLFWGKLSYSTFVIHGIILGTFSCWLFLKLSFLPYHMNCLIMFTISGLFIVVISYYVYRIDRLGIQLANKAYGIFFEPKDQGCPTVFKA